MRIRYGVAAALALVVVLALGSTGTSAAPAAAPGENAVLYWSGIASNAIVVGRAPAASTVLAGMVHGAMYDAVASILGGLEPFATAVRAPEGASADAAVGQAARDVLVARVPGQAANVQAAYDAFMAGIPDGPAKTGGKAVGATAAAGMLAWRTGDHFDDVVPYVQQAPGAGRLRADRTDNACGHEAGLRAALHLHRAPSGRPTGTTSPTRSPPSGTRGTSPS